MLDRAMEFAGNGMTLKWSEAAERAAGAMRRVIVEAGPGASPHDLLRLIYSVDGGPEKAIRGWPLGADPDTGLQRYAADLPVNRSGRGLDWRPVLTHRGREIDPGPGFSPVTTPADPPPEAEPQEDIAPAEKPAAGSGPALEHVAQFTVPFSSDFDPVGATPDGVRLHFAIKEGGRVEGPRLKGDILPRGGDWMRVRTDGIGIVDATALIKPDTGGGLIMLHETGICDFGREGYVAVAKGQLPPTAPVSLAPRYLTTNPDYLWLNRIQGFAVGEAQLSDITLTYDVYCAGRGQDA